MVDTEPCELPKWNDATPFADGLAWVAQRRLIIRSAPTVLAVAARSASDGLRLGGRDRKVSMPIAVIRPSSRLAKSHRMSASLIGPAGALGDQPVVVAAAARVDDDPLAGQPRARTAGPAPPRGWRAVEPPVTREPRKYKERNVSGPQMPSGDSPYSRW